LYRKFTAAHIFNGFDWLPPNSVLITTADGGIVEIAERQNAGDDVEILDGILSPAFVNAHCHLELSHLKGSIAEHTGLVDFVFKIITQRQADAAAIAAAIVKAENQMLQNGTIAVGDICNTTNTIEPKKTSSLFYHNFIEVAGFVPAAAQSRFDAALQILQQFKKSTATNLQYATINPHAPYSVSPHLFNLINQYPGNSLVTMHNQETPAENEFFKTGSGDFLRLYEQLSIDISFYKSSGKSSLQTILPHLTNKQSLLLVHDVCTEKDDIKAVNQMIASGLISAAHFCLCPNANLYISNSLPNVNSLLNNQCSIVLGTDSLASNHQLSILEEMKTLQRHFPQLQTSQLLQWATTNGARALQMLQTLGSFDPGKKPGVVLITQVQGNVLTNKSTAKRII
jgi:cytosine/adenosine deaminase-related metal-dependent hydrolase